MHVSAFMDLVGSLGFQTFGLVHNPPELEPDQAALVVAFPYLLPHEETDDCRMVSDPALYDPRSDATDPPVILEIASFAACNHYGAMVRLLKGVARTLREREGLAKSSLRIGVNSRLPERRLAVLAGLGALGRCGLLVNPAWGTACLLGILVFPAKVLYGWSERGEVPTLPVGKLCGDCANCALSCPVGAIDSGPDPASAMALWQREHCIQHWSGLPDCPERILHGRGSRLYGCDSCVLACPYTLGRDPEPVRRAFALLTQAERRPGRVVSADKLTGLEPRDLAALFKGTALGQGWLPPEIFINRGKELLQNRSLGKKAAAI